LTKKKSAAWIFTTIAILLTLGRFYLHRQNTKRWRWDDYLNSLALLSLIGFTTTYHLFAPIVNSAQLYLQNRGGKLPTDQVVRVALKINAANNVFFFCTIYLVKASFLALYWQIFEVSRRFRCVWCGVTTYTVVSFLASFLSLFWQCGRPEHFLDGPWCNQGGTLLERKLLWMWCALHVFGDFLLMTIPLVMLSRMMMPTSQKIGVAVVFCLVLVTIALDVLRTVFMVAQKPERENWKELWTLLEPPISVAICALPCYGSLLVRTTKKGRLWEFVEGMSVSFGLSVDKSLGSLKRSVDAV
ncbi:hypothetical protein DM02DRAFT_704925, partial [Periconia macrospinosa]